MTEKKSFGFAIVIWLFTCVFGGHRVYATEKMHYILWYWFLTMITLGLLPLVDLFLLKSIVHKANQRKAIEEKFGIYL